jgi:hypothetical protein
LRVPGGPVEPVQLGAVAASWGAFGSIEIANSIFEYFFVFTLDFSTLFSESRQLYSPYAQGLGRSSASDHTPSRHNAREIAVRADERPIKKRWVPVKGEL